MSTRDLFEPVVSNPGASIHEGSHSHVKLGEGKQAVELSRWMRRCSVQPDGQVFLATLLLEPASESDL